jgi:hypothetical protein
MGAIGPQVGQKFIVICPSQVYIDCLICARLCVAAGVTEESCSSPWCYTVP